MPSYYYSSTAGSYTLVGAVSDSATILSLNSVAGLPSASPFKVVLEPGQPTEEIVKVTAVAGTSLTVVRGWDGTAAVAHNAAVTVRHMITAEDFTLSRAHEDATTAHGTTSKVVGLNDAQTLTNKNLASGTNTFPTTLATTTGTQTLSGKTMSGASNTFSNIPQSAVTGLTPMFQSRVMERTNILNVLSDTPRGIDLYQTTLTNIGSISYAAGVYTVGVAGTYAVFATAAYGPAAASAAGVSRRRIYLQVNGADVRTGINDNMLQGGESLNAECYCTVSGQLKLNAGDTVQAFAFQSTGTNLSLQAGAQFGLTRIA